LSGLSRSRRALSHGIVRTRNEVAQIQQDRLVEVLSRSSAATFSPFQRKVSPIRSTNVEESSIAAAKRERSVGRRLRCSSTGGRPPRPSPCEGLRSLRRYVRFLGLQKVPVLRELGGAMAAISDRLSGAMAFRAFQPLDGHGFADLIMTTRRPAAHLGPLNRVGHLVAREEVFSKRHANLAEEPAHHRGVGFDPPLGRQAIAESLKRCASITSNPR
jgi:hypothetical protein